MTIEKRTNWKQEAAENTKERTDRRTSLLVQKELISKQIQSLTINERRSELYDQLKAQQATLLAELATL